MTAPNGDRAEVGGTRDNPPGSAKDLRLELLEALWELDRLRNENQQLRGRLGLPWPDAAAEARLPETTPTLFPVSELDALPEVDALSPLADKVGWPRPACHRGCWPRSSTWPRCTTRSSTSARSCACRPGRRHGSSGATARTSATCTCPAACSSRCEPCWRARAADSTSPTTGQCPLRCQRACSSSPAASSTWP